MDITYPHPRKGHLVGYLFRLRHEGGEFLPAELKRAQHGSQKTNGRFEDAWRRVNLRKKVEFTGSRPDGIRGMRNAEVDLAREIHSFVEKILWYT